jgi:hypothetical protein
LAIPSIVRLISSSVAFALLSSTTSRPGRDSISRSSASGAQLGDLLLGAPARRIASSCGPHRAEHLGDQHDLPVHLRGDSIDHRRVAGRARGLDGREGEDYPEAESEHGPGE